MIKEILVKSLTITGVIIVLFVIFILFFKSCNSDKVYKELKVKYQNELASKDKLQKIYEDSLKQIYQRYSYMTDDFDEVKNSLNKMLKIQAKTIQSVTEISAKIDAVKDTGSGGLTQIDSSMFLYVFGDSSKFNKYRASVWVDPLKRLGRHKIDIWNPDIKFKFILYQDVDGNFSHIIENFTPGINITSDSVVINSDYVYDKSLSFWDKFGIYTNTTIPIAKSSDIGIYYQPFMLGYRYYQVNDSYVKYLVFGVNPSINDILNLFK